MTTGERLHLSQNRMTKRWAITCCAGRPVVKKIFAALVVVFAASAATASAAPVTIGEFFYDTDAAFGPFFTIENFSDFALTTGGTFTNIKVRLFNGTTAVGDIDVGDLDAGFTFNTLPLDLSGTFFNSATLDLLFSLPGSIAVDPL